MPKQLLLTYLQYNSQVTLGKKCELPDHTWDQSRRNAVTLMTFLILETKITDTTVSDESKVLRLTRTGQGVTLLYLLFFEPETTFKCMNEVFLLVNPALFHNFTVSTTHGLKPILTFNGPQEKPSNPFVQMCMAHLLLFLKLQRVCQVSFAEYHSKRNFVEHVHAEENRVLSKHGSFSSHAVHKNSVIGSENHQKNMEHMAD